MSTAPRPHSSSEPLPKKALKASIIAAALGIPLLVGTDVYLRATTSPLPEQSLESITVTAGEEVYDLNVEVVRGEAVNTGLMERDEVPYDGMLFDFATAEDRSLTMFNTKVPLDAVWLDEDYNVISTTTMAPCARWRLFVCPTYSSPEPVRYVLETIPGAVVSESQ